MDRVDDVPLILRQLLQAGHNGACANRIGSSECTTPCLRSVVPAYDEAMNGS